MSEVIEQLPVGFNEDIDPSLLHESPENPRSISEESFDRLLYSMREDPGMLHARPIICTPEGEVVCGNMRLRAARELNWAKVPVYIHEFEGEAQKREWMLRDNQEYGDWVPDQLAAAIAAHANAGFDTKLLGFADEEIDAAIRRATGDAIVPEPSEPPDPKLAAECMVEIRCSRDVLDQISGTLEGWQEAYEEGIQIGVTQ